jgi:hypothetical protein
MKLRILTVHRISKDYLLDLTRSGGFAMKTKLLSLIFILVFGLSVIG